MTALGKAPIHKWDITDKHKCCDCTDCAEHYHTALLEAAEKIEYGAQEEPFWFSISKALRISAGEVED